MSYLRFILRNTLASAGLTLLYLLALALLPSGCGPTLNPPEGEPIPPCATDGGWPQCLCVEVNSTSCLCRLPGPPADRLCWRPR